MWDDEWVETKPELPIERVCAKCGKKFIPAIYHRFVTYYPVKKYFCKWTCYNHRNDPVKKYRRKPVLMYDKYGNFIKEFDGAQEAAMWLIDHGKDADNRCIQRCCRGEFTSYHGFIFKYKE